MIDLKNRRAFTAAPGTLEDRVATLERIILDQFMEIEALRTAMIALVSQQNALTESDNVLDDSAAGVSGAHTVYGKAYLETAWLTHWAAGPTCGHDKLLERFYGDGDWREMLMLARLGYSRKQQAQYAESAEAAETCS